MICPMCETRHNNNKCPACEYESGGYESQPEELCFESERDIIDSLCSDDRYICSDNGVNF